VINQKSGRFAGADDKNFRHFNLSNELKIQFGKKESGAKISGDKFQEK
jgi:hypothetical protein